MGKRERHLRDRQTRVEDGGLKLIYLTHWKRETREGAVGEEGALAETRVWSHQDSGLQSPPLGVQMDKSPGTELCPLRLSLYWFEQRFQVFQSKETQSSSRLSLCTEKQAEF